MDPVDRRQQLAAQRVAGLVVGDDALLVVGECAARLHPGDDPLERGVEVLHRHVRRAPPGGEDRGLVADVREVGARQPRGLARDQLEVDVLGQRLVARMDLEDPLAAEDVGR